ncbi:hypothetical protein [Nocardia asiatica]|uniref:hypothetical protein n=1 Tax=Nocardia asiatica TaxID=209252 RepID=UPI003EE10ADC
MAQPVPPAGGWAAPDAARYTPPPGPIPATGYGPPGPGYGLPPYPPRASSRTGLIAAGVIALAAALAVGVVIGVVVGDRDSESATAATPSSTSPSPRAASTTPPRRDPAPGTYSISGITNSCDLVDPTPLHKWSSTPKEAPQHREYPPSTADGGNLYCAIRFISPSTLPDDATVDEAGISLQAQITGVGASPAYDRWKQTDTAGGAGRASGEITGIGVQGYWHTATTDTGNGMTYIVGAQDSNVSVRVQVAVLRAKGEPPPNRSELATIAENQARKALDGLKK